MPAWPDVLDWPARSTRPASYAYTTAAFDPVEVSLVGVFLGGTLLLGILGILVVSGEY